MKNILITGASGFVGSFLVESCLHHFPDATVFAGIRKTSSRVYLTDDRIRFFEMNFNDVASLEKSFRQQPFDYVIHNAGLTKADRKADYFKVNCQFTENLVTALRNAGSLPEKFTYMSSMAAYGPADNMPGEKVVESDTPRPIDTYGESKLTAERYLKKQEDLNYLIFRPTAVYGPREKDIYTFFTILNKGLEPYIGLAEQELTFIYVKDLARLVVEATFSKVNRQSYFVADNEVYSNYDLGRLGKQFLNKRALKIKVPTGLVRGIAWINEAVMKRFGKMPALNLEKVNILESTNWKCDTEPLKQDFNFHPDYDLEAGLKETIAWYKQEGWL